MGNDKTGKFILRVVLGVIVLLHGIGKLQGGIAPIAGMVTANGLPAWVAYGVYAGEVIGPLLLIVGFYARIGAALIAINMLFALFLAHRGEVFALTANGTWAIETQALMLFAAISLVLMGPGKPSINER